MKVIEMKAWVFPFECTKCKSKLEAEKSDVRIKKFNGSYLDNGEQKYYVECCECGEIKIIPDEDIPPKVSSEACRNRVSVWD